MSLTREECENRLDILKTQYDYLNKNLRSNYPYTIEMIQEVIECFESLINENFYLKEQRENLINTYTEKYILRKQVEFELFKFKKNPPLEFEEIVIYFKEKKNRVYLWDSYWDTYRQIRYIKEDTREIQFYDCDYREKFEEDQFYIRQAD